METSSQLLNQFKLFSKKEDIVSGSSSLKPAPSTAIHNIVLFICILAIGALIYFKMDILQTWYANFWGNLWLSSHLTSAGELASIYVPKNFSIFSDTTSAIQE
jgi:hypothetical protein